MTERSMEHEGMAEEPKPSLEEIQVALEGKEEKRFMVRMNAVLVDPNPETRVMDLTELATNVERLPHLRRRALAALASILLEEKLVAEQPHVGDIIVRRLAEESLLEQGKELLEPYGAVNLANRIRRQLPKGYSLETDRTLRQAERRLAELLEDMEEITV